MIASKLPVAALVAGVSPLHWPPLLLRTIA